MDRRADAARARIAATQRRDVTRQRPRARRRSDRRLSVGDPAVVDRQPLGDEHPESRPREPGRGRLQQPPVLEDAAAQHDGPEPSLGRDAACSGARARGDRVVKPCGDIGRRGPGIEIGDHGAQQRPWIESHALASPSLAASLAASLPTSSS